MTTAADIIERAQRQLEKLPAGGTPTTDEYADGLEALNAMVESWRNDKLMCYALQEESLTLSNGTSSYTIGPSGTLTTTRPVAIERAWIVNSNISYDVTLITEDDYASIQDKTSSADWPDRALYRPAMSNGTLLVYPVPNATRTLKLLTRVAVTSFAATSTTVTLPPGWEDALAFNLACRLAPEYGVAVSPDVRALARETRNGLRAANSRRIQSQVDLAYLFHPRSGHIISDQP